MGTYWKRFWQAAIIRAIRTTAQVGVILIGSDVVSIADLDFGYILGCMVAGFVASILTSLATKLPEVDGE